MKRKMLLFLAMGALGSSLAVAQDSTPGSQTAPSDTPSTTQTAPSNPDNSVANGAIQGCLSGSDGSYTLTQDGTGTMFRLMGSDSQLKKHVGHEVAVSGQTANDTSSASGEGQQSAAASGAPGATIQVSDVKMISRQCSTGGTSPQ